MAGTKGKSGGPRKNAGGPRPNSGGRRPNSGGARPGAGRKPSTLPVLDVSELDVTGPIDMQRYRAIVRMNMLDAQCQAAKRGSVAAMISFTKAWQREQKRNHK